MAKKKATKKGRNTERPKGTCGQCKNCTLVTEFHTLSLWGKPTLGTCPNWTNSKCVVLSLDYCDKFVPKEEISGLTETKGDKI